jgi:ribosomal protein S18 acetylase RimI-like enzyme
MTDHTIAAAATTEKLRQQVDALIAVCSTSESLMIPLHDDPWTDTECNQFVCFKGEELVGIATIPTGTDVEVLGVAHPRHRREGIGRKLLAAVTSECTRRGVGSYLVVVEQASAGGCAFADALGGTLEFSEHLMQLRKPKVRSEPVLDLVVAGAVDFDDLVALQQAANPDAANCRRDVTRWLNDSRCQVLIAHNDVGAIGMIRLTDTVDERWINSFTVSPAMQGQGVGRDMLATVMRSTVDRRLLLEVETDNTGAISLYRSAGFATRTTYNYYRYDVDLTT